MSALNEQEIRDQLDDVTDDAVLEQRRRLEEGEEQPTPVIIDEHPVIEGVIEIGIGESVEVPLEFDPSEFVTARGEGDRTMLVIRQRSLTENLFSVVIELGELDGFDELIRDVGERLVARDEREQELGPVVMKELFFFDHVDDEHHQAGELIESVSAIGHYSIDVADQIEIAAGLGIGQPALRLTVLALHDEAAPTVPFLIGDVTVANVQFVFSR